MNHSLAMQIFRPGAPPPPASPRPADRVGAFPATSAGSLVRRFARALAPLCAALCVLAGSEARAQGDPRTKPAFSHGPTAERLYQGKTAEAAGALVERLKASPGDDQARMELGFTLVVRAAEQYLQFLHRKGVLFDAVPPFNMPLRLWDSREEERAGFEKITYDEFDAALAKLASDLGEAEKTLAPIRSREVAFLVDLSRVAVDANGDGKIADDERFVRLWARPAGGAAVAVPEKLDTRFDYADALWLRGYCHAVSAMTCWVTAYDFREMFETSGVLLFAKVEPLRRPQRKGRDGFQVAIMDVIAAIHLCRGKVKSPERRKEAWEHAKAVVALGRETRTAVLAETDDDREWLPNPKQRSVLGIPIANEMVGAWGHALDELDLVLDGKRLLPHPIVDFEQGVNLKKLLLESDEFDLVMWFHGEGMKHALEKGQMTDQRTWRQVEQAFGPGWPMYTVFINTLAFTPAAASSPVRP